MRRSSILGLTVLLAGAAAGVATTGPRPTNASVAAGAPSGHVILAIPERGSATKLTIVDVPGGARRTVELPPVPPDDSGDLHVAAVHGPFALVEREGVAPTVIVDTQTATSSVAGDGGVGTITPQCPGSPRYVIVEGDDSASTEYLLDLDTNRLTSLRPLPWFGRPTDVECSPTAKYVYLQGYAEYILQSDQPGSAIRLPAGTIGIDFAMDESRAVVVGGGRARLVSLPGGTIDVLPTGAAHVDAARFVPGADAIALLTRGRVSLVSSAGRVVRTFRVPADTSSIEVNPTGRGILLVRTGASWLNLATGRVKKLSATNRFAFDGIRGSRYAVFSSKTQRALSVVDMTTGAARSVLKLKAPWQLGSDGSDSPQLIGSSLLVSVYSEALAGGPDQFWVVPLASGRPRILAQGPFGSAVASPDGTWVATTFATVKDDVRSPHRTTLRAVGDTSTTDLGTADVLAWTR